MTICYFSAQYLPTAGGVEHYTHNLALRAVKAGHHAIVVTSALPGLPAHETDVDGIEIFRLPVFALMAGRFPVPRFGSDFSALAAQLFALPLDFCVIQTKMYLQSVWASREAARRGIPAIVIEHSTGYMPMGRGPLAWLARRYEHWACGRIKRSGVDFYGVSADVCRWLQTFGVTAKGELPNAVDPAALAAEAAIGAPDWRSALHLAPATRLVVFVGRLIPEKGAASLMQAVAGLPGVALAVAGTGPILAQMQAEAPTNVHILGRVSHPDTLALLAQADVYCLPTCYAEGFPTTLLEAAALHCPLLCTATAGTGELMPGPGYGTLLPDAAPDTIRTVLAALFADYPSAQASAQACYQNLICHFTWEIVFAKIVKIAKGRITPQK